MVTYTDIAAALDATPGAGASRPILEALYTRNEWLLKPMLAYLEPAMLPDYVRLADEVWSTMRAISPLPEAERVAQAVRGLQFHSMEFLKLQMQFAKAGAAEYKAKDYDKVFAEVYGNASTMQQYLDGLLLTYISWPNHHRLLRWYIERYTRVAAPGKCLEIGPGHGWLALEQVRSNPANTLLGLDISPHSVAYTNAVLGAAGPGVRGRYRVIETDAQKELAGVAEPFQRIVVAEVIEHLPDPGAMLRMLARHATRETLWFITTVVNIEAPDHLFLFRSLEEVREFFTGCGLAIVEELDLELKMSIKLPAPAFETAYVCRLA